MHPSCASTSGFRPQLRRPLLVVAGLLLGAATASPGAPQQTGEEQPRAFGETIEISAVSVLLRARDAEGRPVSIASGDLEVFEDEAPRRVLALEPLEAAPGAGGSGGAAVPEGEVGPEAAARRPEVFLYVDPMLAGRSVIGEAIERLDPWLDELCAVGAVTLVVANPDPVVVIEAGSDPESIRRELQRLKKKSPARGEVERIRWEYRRERPIGSSQIRWTIQRYATEEAMMLGDRRRRLATWLVTRSRPERPKLLMTVSGAYDSDLGDYYLAGLRDSGSAEAQSEANLLQADLARLAQGPLDETLGNDLAAAGWVVFPVVPIDAGYGEFKTASAGGHDVWRAMAAGSTASSGSSPFLFTHPIAGWRTLSAPTGGEVVTSDRGMADLMAGLGNLWLLTYERVDPTPGHSYRLDVRSRRPGVEVLAPRWRSESTPAELSLLRALAALESGQPAGDLGFEVAALRVKPGASREELAVTVEVAGLAGAAVAAAESEPQWVVSVVSRDEDDNLAHRVQLVRGAADPLRIDLRLPASSRALGIAIEEFGTGSWGARSVEVSRSR